MKIPRALKGTLSHIQLLNIASNSIQQHPTASNPLDPIPLVPIPLVTTMSPERSSTDIGGRRRPAIASLMLMLASSSTAFSFNSNKQIISRTTAGNLPTQYSRLSLQTKNEIDTKSNENKDIVRPILSTVTAASLALALAFNPISSQPAFAYEESDYASETVTNVVAQLKSTAGDVDGTFNTLEEVSKIITEGKGVGGTLTYGA